MKNIPNYFYRPDTAKLTDAQEIRKRAELPDDKKLYVVPQTLFKLHPDFDAVLGEILRRDRNGLLILFENTQKALHTLLMDRFRQSIPDVAERIIFLPFLSFNNFLSFINSADAVLDTPYFCGGTTSLEMFSIGCPIVTWPKERMASRFTYAYYKKMGVMDLVCKDSEQYIQRAVRLANDADWKKQISEKIRDRNSILYNNPDSLRELEQFLLSVGRTSK
jgi:predicted O-linked N-acetylglucosamine transferase (SPINDLY family)